MPLDAMRALRRMGLLIPDSGRALVGSAGCRARLRRRRPADKSVASFSGGETTSQGSRETRATLSVVKVGDRRGRSVGRSPSPTARARAHAGAFPRCWKHILSGQKEENRLSAQLCATGASLTPFACARARK